MLWPREYGHCSHSMFPRVVAVLVSVMMVHPVGACALSGASFNFFSPAARVAWPSQCCDCDQVFTFHLVVPPKQPFCLWPLFQPLHALAQAPAQVWAVLVSKAQPDHRPGHQPFNNTNGGLGYLCAWQHMPHPKRKALSAHGAQETAIPCKPLYLGFLDQSLNSPPCTLF